MSYLRCQSFQDVAPVTVAVRVEVILKRRVKGHSPRLDTGVTVPADTQTLRIIPNTNIFAKFLYLYLPSVVGSCCGWMWVSLAPRYCHILNQTAQHSSPPCSVVSVRVGGQVLSHGRHNSPNDWQVDTRAELWLWLPMRRFRGARCANRTRSSDSVHTDKRKKIEIHFKGFEL